MDDTKPQDSAVSTQEKTDQKQIDAAVAALGNDAAIEKEGTKVEVEEHQISDEEAKKYAGAGDFSLPITASPLDDLIGKNQEQEAKKEQQPAPVSQPTAMPQPAVDPKDLEKKAQSLLQELDGKGKNAGNGEAGGIKPKKKRSGTAVKMALAAVLVVMMGAGGIVGMNLLKMQQSAENRSAAYGDAGNPGGNYCCRFKCCDGTWIARNCQSTAPGPGVDMCAGVDFSSMCANHGGYGNCSVDTKIVKCSCENWSNGCGYNCVFPDGTQQEVNRLAAANCKPYVAVCLIQSGEVRYEVMEPGQSVCYDKLDECKNPHADNPCSTPTPVPLSCTALTSSKTTPVMGDTVTFTCASSGEGLDHYEFRYNISGGAWQMLLASSTSDGGATTSNTARVIISQPGTYTVQCRACKDAQGNNCTPWGLAQ